MFKLNNSPKINANTIRFKHFKINEIDDDFFFKLFENLNEKITIAL